MFIFSITTWPLQLVFHFIHTVFPMSLPVSSTVLDSVNLGWSQLIEY